MDRSGPHDRLGAIAEAREITGKPQPLSGLDQEFVDLPESLLPFLARGREPDPTLIVFGPGYGDLTYIHGSGQSRSTSRIVSRCMGDLGFLAPLARIVSPTSADHNDFAFC